LEGAEAYGEVHGRAGLSDLIWEAVACELERKRSVVSLGGGVVDTTLRLVRPSSGGCKGKASVSHDLICLLQHSACPCRPCLPSLQLLLCQPSVRPQISFPGPHHID
jgi:hypothetical protein